MKSLPIPSINWIKYAKAAASCNASFNVYTKADFGKFCWAEGCSSEISRDQNHRFEIHSIILIKVLEKQYISINTLCVRWNYINVDEQDELEKKIKHSRTVPIYAVPAKAEVNDPFRNGF